MERSVYNRLKRNMAKYIASSSSVMNMFIQQSKKSVVCLCSMLILLVCCQSVYAAMSIRVPVKDGKGVEDEIDLYGGSYALLIGASVYKGGWPSLESIPGELDNVENLLKRKGFQIERINDPDSKQLKDAFTGFINRYGYDRNNRLLIFYSGHGYTRNNGKKGYLVPVDAPDPDKDEKGFLISMFNDIL